MVGSLVEDLFINLLVTRDRKKGKIKENGRKRNFRLKNIDGDDWIDKTPVLKLSNIDPPFFISGETKQNAF